jgi:hypothetical protein
MGLCRIFKIQTIASSAQDVLGQIFKKGDTQKDIYISMPNIYLFICATKTENS